jgi:hypothetical protein
VSLGAGRLRVAKCPTMVWKPWAETVCRPLTEADAHAEAWGDDCLGYEAAQRAGLDPLDSKARRKARRS